MEKNERQKIGMAGEFLVAGKLFKLGLQVSVTFGNAKGIDLMARKENGKNYSIQVKTQKNKKEDFFLKEQRIENDIIFIFVALNKFDEDEEYYIVKGSEILEDVKKFYGKTYNRENPSPMSAIRYNTLTEKDNDKWKYKDNWKIFDQ